MTCDRRLSIILPSYKDQRITRAIRSIREFDDAGLVQIVIVDGGSGQGLLDAIRAALTDSDVLLSDPDKGIFDALNKGLDRCDTEFIGWLGSDDMFTGRLRASEVVLMLESHDLFIANMVHFRGEFASRTTFAWPAAHGLVKFGFNNPHFSTFGKASLFKSKRFILGMRASDIDYFLRVFAHRPDTARSSAVAVVSEEGGFSSESRRLVFQSNMQLVGVYARHTGMLIALLSVVFKLVFKSTLVLAFRLRRIRVRDLLTFDPGPL